MTGRLVVVVAVMVGAVGLAGCGSDGTDRSSKDQASGTHQLIGAAPTKFKTLLSERLRLGRRLKQRDLAENARILDSIHLPPKTRFQRAYFTGSDKTLYPRTDATAMSPSEEDRFNEYAATVLPEAQRVLATSTAWTTERDYRLPPDWTVASLSRNLRSQLSHGWRLTFDRRSARGAHLRFFHRDRCLIVRFGSGPSPPELDLVVGGSLERSC